MNKVVITLLLLFMIAKVNGQDITRQDADSMLAALKKSKPGIHRIDLLLHLAQFQIFKPGEIQKDFDSAMVFINQAKLLNLSLKSSTAYGYQLLTESYLTKEKGNRDKGKKMAEQAVTILEPGSNKSYLGQAYFELSNYYDYTDSLQLSKRMELVNQAIDAFNKAGDLARKGRSLEMLGDLYTQLGQTTKQIEVLNQALAAYDSVKYKRLQGVYFLLGQAYYILRDYGPALHYSLKALKIAGEIQDSSIQLCRINNVLGSLYTAIDWKDISLKYDEAAFQSAKKNHDNDAIFLLAVNNAIGYSSLGKPDQALVALTSLPEEYLASDDADTRSQIALAYLHTYTVNNQFDKARPYCDTIVKIADGKLVPDRLRNTIYRFAATYYYKTKQYANVRSCLLKNADIQKRTHYLHGTILDAKLAYKLDSLQGDFRSAFNHLNFLKTKNDSIFSENRVKQLQVLGVQYETAIKEDSIKLKNQDIALLTQKNSLQQANLQQAGFIKNVTIAGIILTFIIIGLLYRQYRHKQKSNTVITQKNEQLQHYLTEKEWLLKEIHHRVKNNLQIVMSLLNSQSAYIDNEPALTAIHDSQHRVHAMSLIHQKLYGTDNVSSIDMPSYIRELASYLRDSFDTGQRIRFEFDITPLELDVSQAVPVGLILNEAITNSIKYAFPNDSNGIISITLTNTSPHHYLLTISDNGIGMPAHSINKRPGSLGMSLMTGLAEDLDGNFAIENDKGTTIKISFVHDINIKRSEPLVSSFITAN